MVTRSLAVVLMTLHCCSNAFSQSDVAKATLEYEHSKNRAKEIYRSKLPLAAPTVPRAIYGMDDRKDFKDLDATQSGWAKSTCILTNRSRVTKDGANYKLTLEDYEQGGFPCCGGERFATQKVGGWCSGFLVGEDIVVTAGHCTEATDDSVKDIAFVFGYTVDAAGETPSKIAESGVYFGKNVIKHRLDSGGDFAIIQLDRKVPAGVAKPLAVAATAPAVDTEIVLVGYPSGLPCKAAGGDAKVMEHASDAWLRTNCDAYAGNSGSAVVDSSGAVIGILVRGRADFEITTMGGNNCFKSRRYHETEGDEILTRTEVFRADIP